MKTYTGLEYLKIDIANHFGLDKEQFSTRIDWVNAHEHELESLTHTADSPVEYAAAVMALRDTQAGKPTGHLVGLDACASGPSIMSVLTGCKAGAENTGLTGQVRKDLYTECTKEMNKILGTSKQYDRKEVKGALMPCFYGSKRAPKRVFGEDTEELEAFYAAQRIVAPGATALMPIMLDAWQPHVLEHSWIMPDGFYVRKKVSAPADVKIEVDELDHTTFTYCYEKNEGVKYDVSLPADIIQSIDGFVVREMGRRCNFDRDYLLEKRSILQGILADNNTEPLAWGESYFLQCEAKHNFTSLVGVDYFHRDDMDCYTPEDCYKILNLVNRTLSRPSFELVMIHDNFKCHPNYMDYVRQNYIDIFVELAESTVLDAILTKIKGIPTHVKKLSDNLGELIRDSEYALS